MPRLLLINPNTSEDITSLLLRQARAELRADIEIVAATARFGAAFIGTGADYTVAGDAVLDAHAASRGSWDAVLIGCFADPGLAALRAITTTPVVTLVDAAMEEAAAMVGPKGRFAIVTGGSNWEPMLMRIAASLGHAGTLAGVCALPLDGTQIARNPDAAMAALRGAVTQAVNAQGAQAVIVGGAGLGGLASRLQPDAAVPLIDSVRAGMRSVAALLPSQLAAPA